MGPDNLAVAPESEVRPPLKDGNAETPLSVNAAEQSSPEIMPGQASNRTGDSTTKSCPICMRLVFVNATECDCGFLFDG